MAGALRAIANLNFMKIRSVYRLMALEPILNTKQNILRIGNLYFDRGRRLAQAPSCLGEHSLAKSALYAANYAPLLAFYGVAVAWGDPRHLYATSDTESDFCRQTARCAAGRESPSSSSSTTCQLCWLLTASRFTLSALQVVSSKTNLLNACYAYSMDNKFSSF